MSGRCREQPTALLPQGREDPVERRHERRRGRGPETRAISPSISSLKLGRAAERDDLRLALGRLRRLLVLHEFHNR